MVHSYLTSLARTCSFVGLLWAPGCSSTPSSWQLFNDWLAEEPRSLAIVVDTQLPTPKVVEYEYGSWVGGLAGYQAGTHDGLQCAAKTSGLCGIIFPLFPLIYATAGASARGESYLRIDEVPGTEAVFDAVVGGVDLRSVLRQSMLAAIYDYKGETYSFSRDGRGTDFESASKADAILNIEIVQFNLARNVDNDSVLQLVVGGFSTIESRALGSRYSCRWIHNSEHHSLKNWTRDNAKLFRREISLAADDISNQVVTDLFDDGTYCEGKEQSRIGSLPYLETTHQREHNIAQWRRICLAAHGNSPSAQKRMGDLYSWGTPPLSQDWVNAHKWYSLAEHRGNLSAGQYRQRLAERLSDEEVRQSEFLVTKWRPALSECDAPGGENAGEWVLLVTSNPHR